MAQVAPAAAAELLPCQRDSYLRTVQALFEVRARGAQNGGKTSQGAGLSGCPALPPAAPRRCHCDRAAIVCRGRSACVEGAGRHEGRAWQRLAATSLTAELRHERGRV